LKNSDSNKLAARDEFDGISIGPYDKNLAKDVAFGCYLKLAAKS